MSSKVALFCTVGGVWYVAGGFAERSNYIALSFLLKCSSGRLKFDCIICRRTISGKGSSGGTKIDTLVDGQVSSRIDAIFLQYEFKYHLRHAAGSSAIHIRTFQIFPLEIINGSPGYKKVTGPLGQLCKIDQIIVRILLDKYKWKIRCP